MSRSFEMGDRVRVSKWGSGIIIGSCPWQVTDITPNGKVWIVKLSESGKVITSTEKGLGKS